MSRTKSSVPVPSAAELRRLYVDQGVSMVDIGKACGRDPKTILYWMRQHGIQTRPRGSDARQHFPKGHKRSVGRVKSAAEREKIRAATIARGGVPYLRNGVHWLTGQPPSANGRWKGGATPERQAFYRSPEWKAACKAVWARADAKCERCGKDHRDRDRRTEPKFHIHHIVSFQVRELRAEPSNLALLCRPCHLFVHSNANGEREFLPPAEHEITTPSLFDLLETEAEEAA